MEAHPFDLLLELMQAMGGQIHDAAAAEDLTPMQAMLVDRLEDGVAVPMSDLARQMHCDKSNLTGIVDALEARGLIERTTPPGDRRIRALVTTPTGRAVRARLDRQLRADNPLLARLDPPTRERLQEILAHVLGY
ncbi:MAG: MarR family transcriptional regulator [Geodermatophilaceae bacterium]|nr:MarR family transcriptional regulator [Geodermatophilaceae bacterium]